MDARFQYIKLRNERFFWTCLQIEAVYNMAPWSKSVTLHLGAETHITSGASSPVRNSETWFIKPHWCSNGSFLLPDSDPDSHSDSDSKPYGYIVLCRKFFHWLRFRFGSLSHSICIVQEPVSESEYESESSNGNKPKESAFLLKGRGILSQTKSRFMLLTSTPITVILYLDSNSFLECGELGAKWFRDFMNIYWSFFILSVFCFVFIWSGI